MSLNVTDVTLDYQQDTNCERFLFSFTDNLFNNNLSIYKFTALTLEIGEVITDILSSIYINKTGTISISNGSALVSGIGTFFTTEYSVGDFILISDYIYKISTIASNTSLTLTTKLAQSSIISIAHSKLINTFYIDEDILDGVYDTKMSVTSISGGITETEDIISFQIFVCHSTCCLDKMFTKLSSKICSTCDFEDYIKDLMTLQSLVESLQHIQCCSNTEGTQTIFDTILRICKYNNCESC